MRATLHRGRIPPDHDSYVAKFYYGGGRLIERRNPCGSGLAGDRITWRSKTLWRIRLGGRL